MYRQNGSGDPADISTVYANCQIRRIRVGVIPGKNFFAALSYFYGLNYRHHCRLYILGKATVV